MLKCQQDSCKSNLFFKFKKAGTKSGDHRTFFAGWNPSTGCPGRAGAKRRFD